MASTERQPLSSSDDEKRTTEGDHVVFGESVYDIPRPAMTYCTLAQFPSLASSPEVKVGDPIEISPAADQLTPVSTFVQRPIVADVKLFKQQTSKSHRLLLLAPPEVTTKDSSWSAEAIDRLNILSRLHDDEFTFRFRNKASTFANPSNPKQSVYIDLGEYQTLLGHTQPTDEEEEEERERMGGEEGDGGGGGGVYPLPQPQSYSDRTMKAVEIVTQRFDSFRLRQMRVRSFRDSGTYTRRRSSNCSGGGRRGSRRQSSASVGRDGDDERESANDGDGGGAEAIGRRVDGGPLTERDIYRIEVFYRGGGAEVCVCRCLSDVFLGATTRSSEETHPWVQIHTGVPVLLLNTGEGLRPRELVVVVAQRDTALPLWQDKVSYLSAYHESSPGVHSMKVSGSLSKSVQLRMGEVEAAKNFLEKFHEMTSNPDDELWKISADQTKVKDGHNRTGNKKDNSSSRRRTHVTKADISQPCNWTRLTRVSATDRNFRSAFGDLLPVVKEFIKSIGNTDEADGGEFRPRLPTN